MKKNGFTLVELLITIALIAILGVISVGVIINSLSGAKSDLDEFQKETLISTAKLYFDDNANTSGVTNGTKYNICIQENLVADNYLDESDDNLLHGIITLTTEVDSNGTITKVESSISIGDEENCFPNSYY